MLPECEFSCDDRHGGFGMPLQWRFGGPSIGPDFFVASGNITTARVDAIVTSAVSTLTHWSKGVAAEIVKTGGGDIVYDCRRWIQRHTRLEVDQAMVTRAGKLPCTYVIHVLGSRGRCGRRRQPTLAKAQEMRTVIRNALLEAERLDLTSIAIPGISCDGCDYSKELATKDIVDECVLYVRQYANTTTLKSIVFLDTDVAIHHGFVNALRFRAACIGGCKLPVRALELPFIDQSDAFSTTMGELHLTSLSLATQMLFEQLAPGDPDYRRVLMELPDGLVDKVVSVRRLRVSARHEEYGKLKKLLMNADEVDDLYHGTPDRWRATAIALHGFNLGLRLHGRVHGDGVYASTDVETALQYTFGKGSLVKLRGLVHRGVVNSLAGRNVKGHVHLFPTVKTLLPLMIVDFASDDEQERALVHRACCQL